ncbi:MAG: (Fe-S)-binding protein [Planctomycetota bacterium]
MHHPHPHRSNGSNPAAGIAPELLTRCIHCGLCTASCPTYTETGDENDGPRGRIQIMRMVSEGRADLSERMTHHLELCLDCRACETACPSGVEYGRLIEPFRVAMQENDGRLERRFDLFRELVLLRIFPYPERMRQLLRPVNVAQRLGLFDSAERLGLFKLLPGRWGRMIPILPPPRKPLKRLPSFLPSVGRTRARVALFLGCVADVMFRHVHWATARVLQHNGCDVFVPRDQACCGAIHWHSGDSLGARRLADQNLVAFDLERYDAIIVNHAGCGAMLKEYAHHWRDGLRPHRARFAAKVRDVHEFLDDLGLRAPPGRLPAVATYHDACHLAHGQRVVAPPRRLLAAIPQIELRDLPEAGICCGSAGTYNLNEAEMADRLAQRKLGHILSTGAKYVVAANAGCLLQIAAEIRRARAPIRTVHPMELLDLSYREEGIAALEG